MLRLVRLLPVPVIGFFSSRRDLLLENLALRQQLAVLKRRRSHPRLAVTDRLFWVILQQRPNHCPEISAMSPHNSFRIIKKSVSSLFTDDYSLRTL
jgi:hypothetical protein